VKFVLEEIELEQDFHRVSLLFPADYDSTIAPYSPVTVRGVR
jgi:hypothetical protein